MTEEKTKRLHLIYKWVLAFLIVAVGILFILSCLDIYSSGPRAYSAEAIALRFQRICIPVYITIAGILGGVVINLLLPIPGKRNKAPIREDAVLLKLRSKAGVLDASGQQLVKKEQRCRLLLRIATAAIYVGLMIYPAIYFMTPDHFTVAELNSDIIKAIVIVMIPSVLALILCWVCTVLVRSSMRREIQCYKQWISAGNKSQTKAPDDSSKDRTCRIWIIRGALLAAALILIVIGILNGGVNDVLKKAIAICTECIGLG